MPIEEVGVLGCGLMGAGIVEVCARKGLRVTVVEIGAGALLAGKDRILRSLDRALAGGKLDEDPGAVMQRIQFADDMAALSTGDVVLEAIVEDQEEKMKAFSILDEIAHEDAILASNTSSIPIINLAAQTSRPESVIGIHFFNPVPVMELVEIAPTLLTSQDVLDRTHSFISETLGKDAVTCQDRAGFIVNALLIPYILSAIRMFESGFASRDDIDTGMVEGCRHPIGPLGLADLIGLDTVVAVARSLYQEFKEPLYAPPPLLSRMVQAGLLGRKAGRGFYEYPLA